MVTVENSRSCAQLVLSLHLKAAVLVHRNTCPGFRQCPCDIVYVEMHLMKRRRASRFNRLSTRYFQTLRRRSHPVVMVAIPRISIGPATLTKMLPGNADRLREVLRDQMKQMFCRRRGLRKNPASSDWTNILKLPIALRSHALAAVARAGQRQRWPKSVDDTRVP